MALGVGVALARAERERRARRKRAARERRFRPLGEETPDVAMRRMALGQLDIAIEALAGSSGEASAEERIHEARKALKRMRALLRLLREELGERTYEREHALVRDTGRRLARARDAAVLSATLEDLIARHEALASRGGVRRLRSQLRRECDGAAERALLESAGPGGALAQLRAMRMRVEYWSLAGTRGIEDLEPALERLYATGRKRMRRAAKAGRSRRMRALHEWRKRVKDLRYAQEMLGTGKRAKRADALGELLGEEHDLAVLGERVRREAKAGRMGRRSSKPALRAISKRRKKLRKRALRDGEQLYGRKPKAFVQRMRKASTLRSPGRR